MASPSSERCNNKVVRGGDGEKRECGVGEEGEGGGG